METTTAYNHLFVSPVKKLKRRLKFFGTAQSIEHKWLSISFA